jgi:hypothetical protein
VNPVPCQDKKNVILITGPMFYSLGDEDHFFKWVYSLRGFKSVVGAGTELCITFRSTRLTDRDLNELLALFHRYRLDKRALRNLLEPRTRWSRKLYWYAEVFGRGKQTVPSRPRLRIR